MILMVLTGLGLFIWHLAIHPDPQPNDPGPFPPVRVDGIAPFVAVASQHDDDAAVGFTASLHQWDNHNFVSHLRHIAVKRGWYPHQSGEGQSLVVPETDLHLLYEMEADPIGWVRRHGDRNPAPTLGPADETRLVNVVVWVDGEELSGILRILAIALWVLAAFPTMVFLGRLLPPAVVQEDEKQRTVQQ